VTGGGSTLSGFVERHPDADLAAALRRQYALEPNHRQEQRRFHEQTLLLEAVVVVGHRRPGQVDAGL
jgi:hypothetical protein